MSNQPSLLPLTCSDLLETGHEVRGLWPLVESTVGERLRCEALDRGGFLHDPARMFAVWMYALMKGESRSRCVEELCRYDVRFSFLAGGTRPDHSTLARFRVRFGDCMPELLALVCAEGLRQGLLGSRPLAVDGTRVAGSRSQWSRALSEGYDEDAETMADGHGGYVKGYNAQVAVDTGSTFIAGCHVGNEPSDGRQMSKVLAATRSQSGFVPSSVVADSGYDSSANHGALAREGVIGYVRPHPDQTVAFRRDSDGTLRCPAGHIPTVYRGKKRGVEYDVYRVFRCKGCPLRKACGARSSRRQMAVHAGEDPALRTENAGRCATPEGSRLLRLRGPTVERVFAYLKRVFRFRRFSLENQEGARLEFGLLVLAYNLRLLRGALGSTFRRFLAACVTELRLEHAFSE